MGGQTIKLSKAKFAKAKGDKPRDIYDSYKTMFQYFVDEAKNTIARVPEFTFETFTAEYFVSRDKGDIISQMEDEVKKLKQEGRISTAKTFECTISSLKEFTGKDKLKFKEVTPSFLKKYEQWMLSPRTITWKTKDKESKSREKVNSVTTIGIYLRNVRTIFNANRGIIKGLTSPFGKGRYQIPKGKNIKKALTMDQVSRIAAYNAIETFERRSRDYWLFSYLCNGINIKDIARLKYSDIKTDSEGNAKIVLIRAKTSATVTEQEPIDIPVIRPIGKIIDLWGNKPASANQYIFPILVTGITPEDEYRAIQQTVQTINRNMKRICRSLELGPVTTCDGLKKLDRNFVILKFLSYEKIKKNI
ncbi:MAG: site-specific integrase [Alphaproteobacteria bacterium]|nr:site-specific integrase [Alphaproteobacteria bacterium]